MSEDRLRRVATIGLALAAIGMIAAGVHHVRCTATLMPVGGDGSATSETLPCVETYPEAILLVAVAVGLVGAIAALWAAYSLGRTDAKLSAGRVVVALAAIALLVPTILPILGWASVGFNVRFAADQPDGGRYCTGGSGSMSMPFWLQTSTCLSVLGVIATPLIAVAGALAAIAATRGSRKVLLASVTVAMLALALYVGWIVRGQAEFARSSLIPLLGVLLLAAAIPMLREKRLSEAAQ